MLAYPLKVKREGNLSAYVLVRCSGVGLMTIIVDVIDVHVLVTSCSSSGIDSHPCQTFEKCLSNP